MTASNYLDLDINRLFAEHTIKEIEEIQKKVQHESDRKKIELRTLVGERYRDLILAADTIGKMKITSEHVTSRIIDVEEKFRELQKKYLIGFKIESGEIPGTGRHSRRLLDSVIVQIKILMDIPEHIWSSIERKDLLFASQLYLVAQHINYGLVLEVGNPELLQSYPIVSKQWDIIAQFKNIIFEESNKVLRSLDVEAQSAANCLAAMVLLNGASFSELLEKLISLRSRAIESVIADDRNECSVRSKIKLCIKILIETVVLIHRCFVDENAGSAGLLAAYLEQVQAEETHALISRLDVSQELMDQFLPSVIKHYKLFIPNSEHVFQLPDLRKNVQSWLEWVEQFCKREVTKLLNLIVSVKGLYYVREEAIGVSPAENWAAIWEDLSLPRISFWQQFFQPVITGRAKSIISDKWAESLNRLETDITELLKKLALEKCEYPEHDLRWFVWKDSPNDIPHKLTKNGGVDSKRSLLMKAKGYSPSILSLCENLDKSLHALLADLEQYLYETERRAVSIKESLYSGGSAYPAGDMFSDRAEVQEHLQAVSSSSIERLEEFIRSSCLGERPEHGQRETNAIVMARLLLALTSLSPNLHKCFTVSKVAPPLPPQPPQPPPSSAPAPASASSGLTITKTKWQAVCEKLKEESTFVWSVWAVRFKRTIAEHREKYLPKESFDGFRVHSIVAEWERVTIEEDSGRGKRIKSEIFVPYQPSVQLQKFLTMVTKELNKVIPHTLPRKVLHEIIGNVVTELLNHYAASFEDASDLTQKQAFQLLFDIRYVSLLMIARENTVLSKLSNKACEAVLRHIDPFDYDLFSPFVQSNVKRSVQRSLLIFGNLVGHLEQLHSILGTRAECNSEGSRTDSPSVLALCTGAPWFPPLAVTAPARALPLVSITLPEKSQRRKTTGKEAAKSDSTGASIKSGAAAFFGAMGSDWFGTG